MVTNGKNDTQSVEFREAVLGLEVTPHISKDNNILLDLLVSQNSPGNRVAYGQNEVVSIDKQEINTQVLPKMGKRLYWAVYFTIRSRKVSIKYHYWAIFQVLSAYLVRKVNDIKTRTRYFVTPHILKQGERMEMAKKEKHFKQVEKVKNKVRLISLMFSYFFSLVVCIVSDLFI